MPPWTPPWQRDQPSAEVLEEIAERTPAMSKKVRRAQFVPCLGSTCKGTADAGLELDEHGANWVIECECQGVVIVERAW